MATTTKNKLKKKEAPRETNLLKWDLLMGFPAGNCSSGAGNQRTCPWCVEVLVNSAPWRKVASVEEDCQRQNTGPYTVCFDVKAISKEEREPGITPFCFPFLSLPPRTAPQNQSCCLEMKDSSPPDMDTSISELCSSRHILLIKII